MRKRKYNYEILKISSLNTMGSYGGMLLPEGIRDVIDGNKIHGCIKIVMAALCCATPFFIIKRESLKKYKKSNYSISELNKLHRYGM